MAKFVLLAVALFFVAAYASHEGGRPHRHVRQVFPTEDEQKEETPAPEDARKRRDVPPALRAGASSEEGPHERHASQEAKRERRGIQMDGEEQPDAEGKGKWIVKNGVKVQYIHN
ncbi:hypothetical protein AAVH_07614 [Aphelenchoides avenae]|nr:hypothetical protein AAVH_07614 [Aphelenchus avenae]